VTDHVVAITPTQQIIDHMTAPATPEPEPLSIEWLRKYAREMTPAEAVAFADSEDGPEEIHVGMFITDQNDRNIGEVHFAIPLHLFNQCQDTLQRMAKAALGMGGSVGITMDDGSEVVMQGRPKS
jgi:hypothetical protein